MTKHQSSEAEDQENELELMETHPHHEIKRLSIETMGSPIENNANIMQHLNKIDKKLEEISSNIGDLSVNLGGANSAIRYIKKDIDNMNLHTLPRIAQQGEGNRTHLYNTDDRLNKIEGKLDMILGLLGGEQKKEV